MTWIQRLRSFALVADTGMFMVLNGYSGFFVSTGRKMRLSEAPLIASVGRGIENFFGGRDLPPDSAFTLGELGKALSQIEKKGGRTNFCDRAMAASIKNSMKILQMGAPDSVRFGRRNQDEHRPLFILTSSFPYTVSGYTIRSHNLLRALANAGVNLQAVTRIGYPATIGTLSSSEVCIIDGVTYRQNTAWRLPRDSSQVVEEAAQGVVKIALEHGATVLHTTTDYRNALVVSRAARILGIPWVYEIRGELENTWLSRHGQRTRARAAKSEYYVLSREQETKAAKAAGAVITLSEISKLQFIQRGIDPKLITVVPNAVKSESIGHSLDRTEMQSEIRATIGIDDEPLVGTVTSLVGYEGIDILIRAIPFVDPQVHALIVGDGAERLSLEALAVELGIEERIHFVGKKPHEEVDKWYSVLDIFVIPRKNVDVCRTVTPIKTLQAQVLGIPVVASDLPALREVTGGFATYVEPENPESLAAALQVVLKNSPQQTIDERQLDWLRSRTWEKNADRILDLYSRL